MANPICENMVKGTIGELLVQLRLLQYGVQAAAPIKDSGNDLVAIKDSVIKTIQVKTSAGRFRTPIVDPQKKFHLLALVRLHGFGSQLLLDETEVYLIPKNRLDNIRINRKDCLAEYLISQTLVNQLFPA